MARFLFSFLLLLSPAVLQAQEGWRLLGDINAYAGQYYFQRQSGAVNGYGDINLQLARSLSSDSGFFINERSVYTGFKQVNELAGGGTLFQQSLDNSAGFKWIKRYEGGFSLKPRIGVKDQLFRETNNESWGKGLYDNVRYEAGVALERKTRWSLSVPWTYQLSYDLYYTHYPHFTSLASQFGAALGSPSPGAHVLDAVTNQLTYRSDLDLPGFASVWGMYSLALINYTEAKVVNAQQQYLDAGRSDAYQTLSAGYSKRLSDWQGLGRVRPIVGIAAVLNDLISNQNNFDPDPKRLKYTAGYFNYWEAHLSPTAQTTFLKPLITLRASYDFGYRGYTARLTQLPDATYTNNILYQFTHSVLVEATYPLISSLDLKLRGMYGAASSNNQYQQTYRYDYTSWNYYAGVQWRL